MNIVLIGFMGTGKTVIARTLKSLANFELLDTDHMIEEKAKKKIADIFSNDGEKKFRDLETGILQELINVKNFIISTGGGIVLKENNRELLKRIGKVFWLTAEPKTILQRLKYNKSRPLLNSPDKYDKIKKILAERNLIYTQVADFVIKTDKKSVENIALEIWETYNHGRN